MRSALDDGDDFVGHIHGNRFVLLLQSADWRDRLSVALKEFQTQIEMRMVDEILVDGGFVWKGKCGRIENRSPPRLVIGAAKIIPTQFESWHEVPLRHTQSCLAAG